MPVVPNGFAAAGAEKPIPGVGCPEGLGPPEKA